MIRARIALATSSVVILALVGAVAVAVGPVGSRLWLLFCVVLAVATGVQSVTSEPKELTAALLLSLPPVMALTGEGSPSWVIGPLGVLLFVAGELNALSWRCHGPGQVTVVMHRRLPRVVQLSVLGLAGSLLVAVFARHAGPGGAAAFVLATSAFAALGAAVFRPLTGLSRSHGSNRGVADDRGGNAPPER